MIINQILRARNFAAVLRVLSNRQQREARVTIDITCGVNNGEIYDKAYVTVKYHWKLMCFLRLFKSLAGVKGS